MEKIVAIETSSDVCGVAIISGNKLIAEKSVLLPRNSSSKIFDIIEKVTKKNPRYDAIAVDIGPGSFTGIRIGVSLARAYGQFLDLPVIGISSLDCMVLNAFKKNITGRIFPAIDALRDEVYTAEYNGAKRVSDYCIIKIKEFNKILKNKATIVGKKQICEKINAKKCISVDLTASAVGFLANAELKEIKNHSYQNVLPLYIRRAFAEERNNK